ncbi:RNA polymerase sigma factor [uncultured Dubosiella sp.]
MKYLRIYGNLSFRQIGEVLSVSENAARVQYYRAREKLRKELEEDGA